MIGRLYALVVIAATAILLAVGAAPVSAAPPDAAAEQLPYELTITGLDPVIPAGNDQLRVTAALRNNTDAPLTRVTALLRVGATPFTGSLDLLNLASGDFRPRLPIVRYSTTSPVPAGEARTFTMQLPLAELGLSAPGAYPVAVEAVDVVEGTLAYTPTLLPWMPNGSWEQPTEVAWLWPLTVPPARAPDGLITEPSLAEQFAADGRLAGLLEAATPFAGQLSWVLEPQTQETAAILGKNYQVVGPRGPEDRPAQAEAAGWLDELTTVLSSRSADVSAMGYAYPDTTSLVAAGLTSDVVLATTTAAPQVEQQLGRPVRGGFSWPADGVLNQESLNVLRGAGATTVVLDAATVSSSAAGAVADLATDSGDITGVLADPGLSVAMNLLDDADNAVAARQLLLAATAASALNNPGSSMAAVPSVTWHPSPQAVSGALTATTSAPWLRLVPLASLLDQAVDQRPQANVVSQDTEAAVGLDEGQTFGISLASYVVAVLGQVTDQPSPVLQTFRESLLRSGSAWWRDQPAAGQVQLEQTLAQVTAEQGKLAISTAGTITFPGDQGRVPVTISNDLDVPVNVELQLTSDPEYRLRSEPVGDLQIPAGQRVSLEVPVTVVGSQPVQVAAQLLTPQGLAYGPAEEFQLRSTAYSRVAQWVIVGALALLALLVVRSVVKRIRTSGGEDDA